MHSTVSFGGSGIWRRSRARGISISSSQWCARCLLRFRQFRPIVTARALLPASEILIAVPIFFFCTMRWLTAISLCR